MNAVTTPTPHHPFNEAQWLRILFLIADTEQWLQQLHKAVFYQLPLKQHKKLLRNNWWLGASVLAHILERHYAPLARVNLLLAWSILVPSSKRLLLLSQSPFRSCNYQRVWDAGSIIGYDVEGIATQVVTVIADAAGRIITAFPGVILEGSP